MPAGKRKNTTRFLAKIGECHTKKRGRHPTAVGVTPLDTDVVPSFQSLGPRRARFNYAPPGRCPCGAPRRTERTDARRTARPPGNGPAGLAPPSEAAAAGSGGAKRRTRADAISARRG